MTGILFRGKRLSPPGLLRILFLIAIVTVVEVPVAVLVIARLEREVDFCGSLSRTSSPPLQSTLEVRGVIDAIAFNVRLEDDGIRRTYDIFPALITINVTQVLWLRQNYTGWQSPVRLTVGYDFNDGDATKLTIGLTIETRGYWHAIISHSRLANVFHVAPCVGGSYLRSVDPPNTVKG